MARIATTVKPILGRVILSSPSQGYVRPRHATVPPLIAHRRRGFPRRRRVLGRAARHPGR